LLRGINVGGRNVVRMADLRAAFEDAGYAAVRTYIQSGNVLFESAIALTSLEPDIETVLADRFGLSVVVVVRSHRQHRDVVDGAPHGFGAAPNTIYSDYFAELDRPVVLLDGDSTSLNTINAVLAGTVDAVLVDHGYAVESLAAHEGRLEIVGPSVLLDRGLGIGVRKGSELKGKFDEALASMKADGIVNDLILKWVGPDASTFE